MLLMLIDPQNETIFKDGVYPARTLLVEPSFPLKNVDFQEHLCKKYSNYALKCYTRCVIIELNLEFSIPATADIIRSVI
jgi:hypothetical protein